MKYVLALLLMLCLSASAAPREPPRMLVFTRTAGFRHDSIPAATDALRVLAEGLGWRVDHGEEAAAFTPQNLARYQLLVFANTTGDVLDDAQQAALRDYIEHGGGYVGIHAAADTEYGWPWYETLAGAWFRSHPPGLQTAAVVFEGRNRLQQSRWRVTDELYNYRSNPRGKVHVVATVDERDYDGGTMGADHPIAWCRRIGAGRAWYTGLGHRVEIYADGTFRAHLLRGLRYAAGASADC
jgi:type 1 glutamine amidotransferase